MVNLIAPPLIIFVNNDLTDQVKSVVQKQLFITETITGAEFDARVEADPGYVSEIYGNNLRLLVIRPFNDLTNRTLADLVIFIKAGLASIERSKFGPPGQTFTVQRMYLSQLINTNT